MSDSELSEEDRLLVREYCERFERALESDEPASIEQMLLSAPEALRDGLLGDLLKIELKHHHSAAIQTDVPKLHARFPASSGIVARAVQEITSHASSGEPPSPSQADTETVSPTTGFSAETGRVPVANETGSIIGPYELLSKLGEGGMGSVYLAQQREPVERQVALKIIKLGMDSKQVIARFEAERQALAMMNHNGIARVLDAGTSATGQPYFVMELVKGEPITEYSESNGLVLSGKLALFVDVCRAVQHAHLKGIIHRDIKPSNVLVTEADGHHVAKVIDFGIAKATGRRLTDKSVFTEMGQVIGTLEYMSPEQAGLNPEDVDTRSDIYSLGVLLYELLTGTTPISRKKLRELDFQSMLRAIRESDPPRPSTRLGQSTGGRAGESNDGGSHVARDVRPIRGDLDWIVMKSLEKDRARRYESAGAFADDVERYLRDETVEARPASVRYRLVKFIRRNKTVVAATSIVTLALVLATVVSAWQAVVATKALESERQATQTARSRLGQLGEVNKVLASIFRDLDPNEEDQGGLPLLAQLGQRLDDATKLINGEAIGDPLMVADLQFTLATTQRGLGESSKAVDLLDKALAVHESTLGPDHRKTLETVVALAGAHRGAGNASEAVSLFLRAYKRRKTLLGAEHHETLKSLSRLASAHSASGDLKKGLELQSRAYDAMKRTLGEKHKETIICLGSLAYQTFDMNDAAHDDEAELLYELAVEQFAELYGENHHKTLLVTGSLAAVYLAVGKEDLAIQRYEQVRDRLREKVGPDHASTLLAGCSLAYAYAQTGQSEKGLQLLAENVEKLQQALGADHPRCLGYMNLLAYSYEQHDEMEKAIELHDRTYQLREKKLGAEHPDTLSSLSNLGWCHRRVGNYEDSIRCYGRALPAYRTVWGVDHAATIGLLRNFGWALLQGEHYAEAEKIFGECLPLLESKAPDNWKTFRAGSRLGAALLGQEKYDEAEPVLLSAYQGMKDREDRMPSDSTSLKEPIQWLVDLYEARNADGDREQADQWKALLE